MELFGTVSAVSVLLFLTSGTVLPVAGSDDVSLPELQTLVQQQASLISSLQAAHTATLNTLSAYQASLASAHSKIIVLEEKVATLSKPDNVIACIFVACAPNETVAFTAMFSADDGNNGLPLSPHATLQFDRVVTNAGNGYNPANGIFTAPVAGYYAFSIVMMEPAGNSHSHLALSIVKNGAVVDQVFAGNDATFSWEQGSTHSVVQLSAGDQVWLRQEMGDAIRGSFWTVFTGYLVHIA